MDQRSSALVMDVPGQDLRGADETFDLDMRITVAPDPLIVGQPKMDGYTTYTSCMSTCPWTCVCGSLTSDCR